MSSVGAVVALLALKVRSPSSNQYTQPIIKPTLTKTFHSISYKELNQALELVLTELSLFVQLPLIFTLATYQLYLNIWNEKSLSQECGNILVTVVPLVFTLVL